MENIEKSGGRSVFAPGDVIFTSSQQVFGRTVAFLQNALFGAGGRYYHVALIVSEFELVEFSPPIGFRIIPIDVWLLSRRGQDDFLIMRCSSEVDQRELFSSVYYREGETYSWRSLRSRTRRLWDGGSICSSFVQKVTTDLGLLDETPFRKSLMPNELISHLRASHWEELETQDHEAFTPYMTMAKSDAYRSSYLFHRKARRLESLYHDLCRALFLGADIGDTEKTMNAFPAVFPDLPIDLLERGITDSTKKADKVQKERSEIAPIDGLLKAAKRELEAAATDFSIILSEPIRNWREVNQKGGKISKAEEEIDRIVSHVEACILVFMYFFEDYRSSTRDIELSRWDGNLHKLLAPLLVFWGSDLEAKEDNFDAVLHRLVALMKFGTPMLAKGLSKQLALMLLKDRDENTAFDVDGSETQDVADRLEQGDKERVTNAIETIVRDLESGAAIVDAIREAMSLMAFEVLEYKKVVDRHLK